MGGITILEQRTNQTEVLKKYDLLISKFPLGILSEVPLRIFSFPEGQVSNEEREWANSFLDNGNNKELLELFGKSVGYVGTRGLQLLRDQSNKNGETIMGKIKSDLTLHSLLALLRNEFQSNTLYYEEGLRGARNIDDNFWFGEGDQLDVAGKWLKFSKDAFKEMNEFEDRRTGKLDATKLWIEANFNAMQEVADHNESFLREHDDLSSRDAANLNVNVDHDSERLVFWSSLRGFVDNLELANGQGDKG